jgi:hypothetical protein
MISWTFFLVTSSDFLSPTASAVASSAVQSVDAATQNSPSSQQVNTNSAVAAINNQQVQKADKPEAVLSKPAQIPERARLYLDPASPNQLFFTPATLDNFKIGESNGDWTKVSGKVSRPFWVTKQFLTDLGDGVYQVSVNAINVRTNPHLERSQVAAKLFKGQKITMVSTVGDWIGFKTDKSFEMWAKTDQISEFVAFN